METAMRDAPAMHKMNREAFEQQAAARQAKENLAKEKNMQTATDEYIEGIYLIHMFHSTICVKDDPSWSLRW